jgi:hypothetical protein
VPRILSPNFAREKNKLSSDQVITMAFQVDILGAPAPVRLVNYDQDLTFGGFSFSRFPVAVDSIEDGNAGALVHLQLAVANVDQAVQALLENYWVVDPDWRVTIWTIATHMPNETPFGSGDVFTVMNAVTNFLTVTFDVVAEGVTLTRIVPGRRYTTSGGFKNIPRR